MDRSPAPGTTPSSDRQTVLRGLVSTLTTGYPQVSILHGSRGWGKGALLDAALDAAGDTPVASIDLARCATNPDEFAASVACAVLEAATASDIRRADRPVAPPAARLNELTAVARSAGLSRSGDLAASLASELSGRFGRGDVVGTHALEIPQAAAEDLGRPFAIVARNIDEIARLVPYPGLEDVMERLARVLAGSRSIRLVGSTSPAGRPRAFLDTLTSMLGDRIAVLAPPPVSIAQLREILGDGAAPRMITLLLEITGGRILTAGILARRIAAGETMEEALREEVTSEAGRLRQELRFDYHILIERTRGHAAARAILNVLAREEGLDLSGIAARLRRSAGSTLDYIRWLVEVDLLRREGRRYRFSDPLLRLHVLFEETPESAASVESAREIVSWFIRSIHSEPIALRPRGRPRGSGRGGSASRPVRERVRSAGIGARRSSRTEPQPPARRPDDLIEID